MQTFLIKWETRHEQQQKRLQIILMREFMRFSVLLKFVKTMLQLWKTDLNNCCIQK